MKAFVKENWYKLMIGTSMMMASFGFMVYAISPAYSNSELEKSEMNNEVKLNAPVGTNGVIVGNVAYFVDGGYVYSVSTAHMDYFAGFDFESKMEPNGRWVGSELKIKKLNGGDEIIGKKSILP